MPRTGDLKVWHIPQIPGKPFEVEVNNLDEAVIVLRALAQYDLFQFKNNIRPDYANAQGLIEWDGQAWADVDEDNRQKYDVR